MPTIPFTPNRQPSAPPPDPDDSDFAALKAADNQDSDWYRGQQTDPQGFFALTGQDAWAGLADFRRQTMDRIDQAAQTLTNRIAQDTYRAIADGAANWQDQRLYARHYGAGAAEVEDQARRQGWDQARTQQAKQDYARDFTKAMVEQAATADPQAARALLDRYHIDLAGDRDQLITQIDRHALFATARQTADAVLAQAASPDTPALQAETERMIKAGFRTREQARQRADEETLKQAWAGVKSGQTPDQLPITLRDHPAVIGQWDALWAHALGENSVGDAPAARIPLAQMGTVIMQPGTAQPSAPAPTVKSGLLVGTVSPPDNGNAERVSNNVSSHDRSGLAGTGGQPAKKPWEGKTNQSFREKISEDESSTGKPNNGYKEHNKKGTGALGRYQLKNAALQDGGWKDSHGNWTAKAREYGVNSDTDFLNHPEAQETALEDVMRGVERQLSSNGSTKHVGKTYMGPDGLSVTVTDGGLIAAGHREGAGRTHRVLTKLEQNTKKFTLEEKRVIRRLHVFKGITYTPGGW